VFTVRFAKMPLIRGVGCQLEVIGIPAGMDAAAVMEFFAIWDRTTKELPAEPVGVAVLCLGDAAVGCGHPGEQPAGAEFRMGRPEDREVNQPFQLGATPLGPSWIFARLGHGSECMTRPGHLGCLSPRLAWLLAYVRYRIFVRPIAETSTPIHRRQARKGLGQDLT
jgi:hypothetical protein